jgi:hypothetical protein
MIEHEGLVLSRLGSRFALWFEPQAKRLLSSPLGIGFERPLRLEISILIDGVRLVWPFSPGNPFDVTRSKRTLSTLEFICASPAANVELAATFAAPFFPRDEKISCAPFFYLDVVCRRMRKERETPLEIKVSLFGREGETVSREAANITLRSEYELGQRFRDEASDEFSARRFHALTALIPLSGRMSLKETTYTIPLASDEESAHATFALAAHCDQPSLIVEGTPQPLRYLKWFPRLKDVAAFAGAEEAEIRRKTAFFDETIAGSSLDIFEKNHLAQSLQLFLASTWWTEEDGADWFGSWNEKAAHNDLDSEYKALLFYLNLWPELLEKLLEQRADWALRGSAIEPVVIQQKLMNISSRNAELEHSDGSNGKKNNGCEIFFPVSVGRFLLIDSSVAQAAEITDVCNYLLMLFAHWRWENCFDLIRRHFDLVRKLSLSLRKDAPDGQPTAKDMFDSNLTLRLLCAASAAALMADEAGDEELAQRLLLTARQLSQALKENPQPLDDVDALLPLVICDHLPDLDLDLFKAFSSKAAEPHDISSGLPDPLLHDITGAYFGFNFLRSQRYREVATSREATACQATPFGIIPALLGLKIDRVEQTFCLSPLCVPARLPLIPFADWPHRRMPWVEIRGEGHQIKVDVVGVDLPDGFELAVYPHRELRTGQV